MALARTARGTSGLVALPATSVSTGTFTPSANSLLVAKLAYIQTTAAIGAPVFTVSGGGLTWTEQVHASHGANEDFQSHVRIYTAPVGGSPGSMSVTATWNFGSAVSDDGGSPNHFVIGVEAEDWTGYDTSTPVGLIGSNGVSQTTSHSGVEHLSLGGTTASTSCVTGTLMSDGDGNDDTNNPIGPDTGFSQGFTQTDNSVNGSSDWWYVSNIYQTTAGAVSTCDWASWTRNWGHADAAIEIRAAVVVRTNILDEGVGNALAHTTASFTPPANSLLVVTTHYFEFSQNITTGFTISGGGLTWTSRLSQDPAAGTSNEAWQQIWTAQVGASPSSMTVTVSPPVTTGSGRNIVQIVAYTGHDVASPIGATGIANSQSLTQTSSFSCTLSAAPAASSTVFAAFGAGPNNTTSGGVTTDTGWTEIYENNGDPGLQCMDRSGSTSTTVNIADVDTANVSGGYWNAGLMAIEIKAPVSGNVGAASGTGAAAGVGAATTNAVGAAAGTGSATAIGVGIVSDPGQVELIPRLRASRGPMQRMLALLNFDLPSTGAVTAAVGAASGTGTAAAVGTGITTAIGAASGTGAAAAVGQANALGVGSGAGAGAAAATGAATAIVVGAGSGAGAAAAVGTGIAPAVGSAAGAGAAAAVGVGAVAATGSGAGTGSAAAVGSATTNAVGAGSGTGNATGLADSGVALGAASGTGRASGVGVALFISVGGASGTGAAAAVGRATDAAVGAGAGSGAASAAGQSTFNAVGAASGTGAAATVGQSTAAAVGSGAGAGAAAAVGALGAAGSVGSAAGAGTAAAISRVTVAAIGSAAGIGAAAGASSVVFAGIPGTLNAVERADRARFVVAQPPATPGDLQYGWPDVIVRRRL